MMPSSQNGRGAVVITGASTGIGRATAIHLDGLGFQVFAGVRRVEDGETLRTACSKGLRPLVLDVTDPASIAAAVETVAKTMNGNALLGLVNNAGIAAAGPLEVLPLEELRRQLEVNVIGLIAVTQAFLPQLRAGGGRIVNIGSIGGRVAMPLVGAYCASKSAVEAMSHSLRVELRPWRIPVSLVEPGLISTPMLERAKARGAVVLESLSTEARDLYAATIEAVENAHDREFEQATPASVVAETIARAITAKRPRSRYLVGKYARLQALLVILLPDRVRDAIVTRVLKLP